MNPASTQPTPYDSANDTREHIARVASLLAQVTKRLTARGEVHDASKLAPPEKPLFDEWTPRLAATQYGSLKYQEMLDHLRPALVHHYAENSHHPEHFPEGVAGMSLLDLVEMFCDWKAASERHANGGDIMRSIEICARRYGLDRQIVSILENTARELAWTKNGAKTK